MLLDQEKAQFNSTRGWPALAQLILDLSDKHPVLPPPANSNPQWLPLGVFGLVQGDSKTH